MGLFGETMKLSNNSNIFYINASTSRRPSMFQILQHEHQILAAGHQLNGWMGWRKKEPTKQTQEKKKKKKKAVNLAVHLAARCRSSVDDLFGHRWFSVSEPEESATTWRHQFCSVRTIKRTHNGNVSLAPESWLMTHSPGKMWALANSARPCSSER